MAAAGDLRVGARLDEVGPVDHLAADEAARDVGVDRGRGVERRLAAAERPGARLLLAGGEERDQVELVAEPARDLVERRGRAVAERRGLLVGELGELGLERQVDPARAVLDRDQRLRRQRLEPVGQLARDVGERRAGVDGGQDLAEPLDLGPDLRVARLRLLLDPLEPAAATWSRSATSSSRRRFSRSPAGSAPGEKPSSTTSSASTWRRLPRRAGPVPGTSWTRIATGVTFRAETTWASASSRASATSAMPTFVLPYSPPPEPESARGRASSCLLPAGRRSRLRVPRAPCWTHAPNPTRLSRAWRFTKAIILTTAV